MQSFTYILFFMSLFLRNNFNSGGKVLHPLLELVDKVFNIQRDARMKNMFVDIVSTIKVWQHQPAEDYQLYVRPQKW